MNKLVLIEPELVFGEDRHPLCVSGFEVISRRIDCLLDTGFSLGFAFSRTSIPKFGFKDGYFVSMMLGNGRMTKGIVFVVELVHRLKSGEEFLLGQTSAVFMERSGAPLIGVEVMQLWSPITLDWGQNSIVGAFTNFA